MPPQWIAATAPRLLQLEFRLVSSYQCRLQAEVRKRYQSRPFVRSGGSVLIDDAAAASGVVEDGVHVDAKVGGSVACQPLFRLQQLSRDSMRIPADRVDKRAGEEDEALVEIAPGASPGVLELLVARPKLLALEEPGESSQWRGYR
jgi:hypothetical protein